MDLFSSIDVSDSISIYVDKVIDTSDRIKEIMKKKGYDIKKMSELTGKTRSQIRYWISGTCNLNLRIVSLLEAALNEEILVISRHKFKIGQKVRYKGFDAQIIGTNFYGYTLGVITNPEHNSVENIELTEEELIICNN